MSQSAFSTRVLGLLLASSAIVLAASPAHAARGGERAARASSSDVRLAIIPPIGRLVRAAPRQVQVVVAPRATEVARTTARARQVERDFASGATRVTANDVARARAQRVIALRLFVLRFCGSYQQYYGSRFEWQSAAQGNATVAQAYNFCLSQGMA
jgi:hypothetical protein